MDARRGGRIWSLEGLAVAADAKRAVFGRHPIFHRRYLPAVFVLNMTGPIILAVIAAGLWTYKPKDK